MKKKNITSNRNLGCLYPNKFARKSSGRRISVYSFLVFTLVFIYNYSLKSSVISLGGKEEESNEFEWNNSENSITSTSSLDMKLQLLGNQTTSTTFGNEDQECDLFVGQWVLRGEDGDMEPYYTPGSCPFVESKFNCYHHKRPDEEYFKWQWQPNACNILRLNASDFLERLRGKRMLFVGDSMNRNMWESLVCILRNKVMNKSNVYEISRDQEFKVARVVSFEDYNFSVEFLHAPFLVGISSYVKATKRIRRKKNKNGAFKSKEMETLRLDTMDKNLVSVSSGADIIVFNSWRWWKDEKIPKQGNYFQEGSHVYAKLDLLKAYEKALTTWGKWIDMNIDSKKTKVVFRGYSVSHFRGGKWNTGGKCNRVTEPILDELTNIETYPSKAKILENVLQQMKTRVLYLNISKLTYYRADGHPSIYQKEYKTMDEVQSAAKNSTQDCVHWCLPGVPDTWNELLYMSLLKGW